MTSWSNNLIALSSVSAIFSPLLFYLAGFNVFPPVSLKTLLSVSPVLLKLQASIPFIRLLNLKVGTYQNKLNEMMWREIQGRQCIYTSCRNIFIINPLRCFYSISQFPKNVFPQVISITNQKSQNQKLKSNFSPLRLLIDLSFRKSKDVSILALILS